MDKKYAVPVWQFRRGAVVEFEVFSGKPVQGTIDYLVAYGARNILAVLSRKVEHDGKVVEGTEAFTKMPPTLNLSHATRVISHSTGEVVFKEEIDPRLLKDVADIRASKGYSRRGNRVVLTWDAGSPDWAFRVLLQEYVVVNRKSLAIQPWEVIDLQELASVLKSRGIASVTLDEERDWLERRIDVRTDKLRRFVRQNINRFKCDLNAEERMRRALEEEMYREDEEDDFADVFEGRRTGARRRSAGRQAIAA